MNNEERKAMLFKMIHEYDRYIVSGRFTQQEACAFCAERDKCLKELYELKKG